jgi:hypothetical protein
MRFVNSLSVNSVAGLQLSIYANQVWLKFKGGLSSYGFPACIMLQLDLGEISSAQGILSPLSFFTRRFWGPYQSG